MKCVSTVNIPQNVGIPQNVVFVFSTKYLINLSCFYIFEQNLPVLLLVWCFFHICTKKCKKM